MSTCLTTMAQSQCKAPSTLSICSTQTRIRVTDAAPNAAHMHAPVPLSFVSPATFFLSCCVSFCTMFIHSLFFKKLLMFAERLRKSQKTLQKQKVTGWKCSATHKREPLSRKKIRGRRWTLAANKGTTTQRRHDAALKQRIARFLDINIKDIVNSSQVCQESSTRFSIGDLLQVFWIFNGGAEKRKMEQFQKGINNTSSTHLFVAAGGTHFYPSIIFKPYFYL